jgi:hypothetical protein
MFKGNPFTSAAAVAGRMRAALEDPKTIERIQKFSMMAGLPAADTPQLPEGEIPGVKDIDAHKVADKTKARFLANGEYDSAGLGNSIEQLRENLHRVNTGSDPVAEVQSRIATHNTSKEKQNGPS